VQHKGVGRDYLAKLRFSRTWKRKITHPTYVS
jgi:hypothetical protein